MVIAIHVDGSCIGNHLHDRSKRKSFTAQVMLKNGVWSREILEISATKTNQQAEWEAVVNALKYAQQYLAGEKIQIFSDCKTVVNIINGDSQAKDQKLKLLYKECENLKSGLNVTVTWIPRAENLAGRHIERNLERIRGELYGSINEKEE